MREDHIVITIFYAFKQEDYLAFRRHHPGITALHARVQDSINYLQNYVKERESVENITDTISHRCCIYPYISHISHDSLHGLHCSLSYVVTNDKHTANTLLGPTSAKHK